MSQLSKSQEMGDLCVEAQLGCVLVAKLLCGFHIYMQRKSIPSLEMDHRMTVYPSNDTQHPSWQACPRVSNSLGVQATCGHCLFCK